MIDTIICCYWFSIYSLLYFGFNLSKKNTIMIAAFIHATLTSTYSAIILNTLDIDFFRHNSLFEIVIIKTSIWYFIYDLLYLIFISFDIIYIIHHLCAIIAFQCILNLEYGCSICMLILFLGEISNPFRLAKQMIYEHNRTTYTILNFLFSWIFIIIRCPLMTYYSFIIHKDFLSNLHDLNIKYTLYTTMGIGLLGGYYWSYLLIKKKIFN